MKVLVSIVARNRKEVVFNSMNSLFSAIDFEKENYYDLFIYDDESDDG